MPLAGSGSGPALSQGFRLGPLATSDYTSNGLGLSRDETPDWRALWFPGDRYTIQKVQLYRYR